jgi:NAD-dependent deacetylase
VSDPIESLGTRLQLLLEPALSRAGRCIFLTGAGISAESGVPTFRGSEGYWRIGSRNYHPQELATRVAFDRMPEAVWSWYLHRLRICAEAQPNVGHLAVTDAAACLGERFLLITQNVDGLHRRAGAPAEQMYEIHGNISFMRCSARCEGLSPVPVASGADPSDAPSTGAVWNLLRCKSCGALMRPHVLWFDEFYDEESYRFESSLRAAADAALLVVVGTTGTTSLPLRIGEVAARGGTPFVVINPEPSPFSELAAQSGGIFLQGRAGQWLPEVARQLRAATARGAGLAL